ncbi:MULTISPECIES: hypothetical protein [unclassified Arenibacter]|nr:MULTISPECIES: hypothetical protein [unclassified Arenibacter]
MKYVLMALFLASMLSCMMDNKTREVEAAKPILEDKLLPARYPEPLLKVF